MSLLDDACQLSMFNTYEPHISNLNKGMELVITMRELGYIDFDSEIQMLKFTNPGFNYLKNHGNTIRTYIQKYNIQLEDFGPMTGYMEKLFDVMEKEKVLDLSSHPILNGGYKLNNRGEIEQDYDNISFSKKAPGEVIE